VSFDPPKYDVDFSLDNGLVGVGVVVVGVAVDDELKK